MNAVISPVNVKSRADLDIRPGDTVRVYQKVIEKGKTRLQPFEGIVLARKHGTEAGATFTVRKVSFGVGIERIYPLYSPAIDKIEILRRAKVRRAKLYYIREKVAREIRRQMRRMRFMDTATVSEADEAAEKLRADEAAAEAAEAETQEAQSETSKDEQQDDVQETEDTDAAPSEEGAKEKGEEAGAADEEEKK